MSNNHTNHTDSNGTILHSNTTKSSRAHDEVDDRGGARVAQRSGIRGPEKSVEGWILFVTGVHEETDEDDLQEAFSEYAPVKHICVNRDRRTGFAKGYAFVEYETFTEAQDTINGLHGKQILGKQVGVDWAFVKSTSARERRRI
mmetsp:Transcript_8755/g.13490  ORF Transcript_8755/g.13490 Transcript_8755/m.13490 type:complete len:144 (-) Transcript_8755:90-521(-)